jgi:hypothetical protein
LKIALAITSLFSYTMANLFPNSVRELLLARCSLVSLSIGNGGSGDDLVRAAELELAELGYVVSDSLRHRLATCSPKGLLDFLTWTVPVLLAKVGADRKHVPLFRNFPQGVPSDTEELWWRKVLVHFLQSDGQPCLFCGQVGTTHVLQPCKHVVCSNCFDGSNYSACPSCEHHVDMSSPFFTTTRIQEQPKETITFKRIDLAEDQDSAAQNLFASLCNRTQAMSPVDREALGTIVREYGSSVLNWIPELIPVRENIALVFGKLILQSQIDEVMPIAKRYFKTATDVLRFIAVASGTDGSLQPETVVKTIDAAEKNRGFWDQLLQRLELSAIRNLPPNTNVQFRLNRFKVVKLSRPLRRFLLEMMNGFSRTNLIEDMLRHRSYWVWVGEFLHPHEYAKRYPLTAEAFEVVRKRTPDGKQTPKYRTWNGQLEESLAKRRGDRVLQLLCERPGVFARRLDHALRTADDSGQLAQIADAFIRRIQSFATPVLLTLASHLPLRTKRSPQRVYWPKTKVGLGVFDSDKRPTLQEDTVRLVCDAIDEELLSRFSRATGFGHAIIDIELENIVVPFNERTASVSATSLPRGSKVAVSIEKTLRMFLHWCQPKTEGSTTDLDLSVALYDQQWKYLGVCSYYQLKLVSNAGKLLAVSAGDLRDASWPDGATEFVDLKCDAAKGIGAKYAVMVVNNYYGMPFSQLERGFAGLMLRDDDSGQHFDPRTVKLKFALAGENGTFMPLVLDLEEQCMHWLDVQSKGQLQMNNVANSNSDITKICPGLISYFRSGARSSMYELGLLHAAARCKKVTIRGARTTSLLRGDDESCVSFLKRLRSLEIASAEQIQVDEKPVLGFLLNRDIDLPISSSVYAVFAETTRSTLSASDLLAF